MWEKRKEVEKCAQRNESVSLVASLLEMVDKNAARTVLPPQRLEVETVLEHGVLKRTVRRRQARCTQQTRALVVGKCVTLVVVAAVISVVFNHLGRGAIVYRRNGRIDFNEIGQV